jgi:Bacterial membrane protein YfhO
MAAAVFAAAALAYLWPALVGSRVVWPGVKNPVESDVVQDFVLWLEFAREGIRAGHLPGWNPYVLSGAPFFANPQAAVASPINLAVWLLPFGRGLAVSYALKLWIGAMGAFALTRSLGLRTVSSLVAGLAYGFLPFAIVWLQYPHANVWPFLPWMLWASERVVRERRARDAAWLAVASAAALAGGHPESALHVAAISGLYVVLRLLQADLAPRERLIRLALAAAGGLAGGLLAAAVFLPVLLNFTDSAYTSGRHIGAYHLPLADWRTILFPDWWGRPTGQELPGGPNNFSERTLYPGAVALVMAGIGLATTSWRRTLPWLLFAVIGLSVALGLPPVFPVVSHLPVFETTANTRLIWLLGLATSVLAAYGTEQLVEARRPRGAAVGVAVGAVVVGLVAVATQHPSLHALRLVGNHFRTGTDWPQVLRLVAVVWFVLLAAIVLVVVCARRYVGAGVAVALLLGALGLDLGHFSHGYNPMLTSSFGAPELRGHDRALVEALPPDAQMQTGLRDARGHDPPQPRGRYFRLWKRGRPNQLPGAPITIGGPQPHFAGKQLLRLLAVREYIGPAGVSRDPSAQPRAFVPASVTRVGGERQALATMFAPAFTPGRDAVVEGAAPPGARGTVSFSTDGADRVDLRARLASQGLVVLADQLDRGWSVTVDGHAAQPLRVDSVLRGVAVPAGVHMVSWRYRVPGLRGGLLLSALGLLLTGALSLWGGGARQPSAKERPAFKSAQAEPTPT